jgi:hypothetical protein
MAARSSRVHPGKSVQPSKSNTLHHHAFHGSGIVKLQSIIGNQAVQRLLMRAPDEEQRKPFSPQEYQWIGDVWSLPEVEMLFQAYDQIPGPVLHRVTSADGAEGVTAGEDISIADRAYDVRSTYVNAKGKSVKAPSEAEFKSTLLHELLHFFFNHTEDITSKEVHTPKSIQQMMIYPEKFGMAPHIFGWFQHPTSDYILHFDLDMTSKWDKPEAYLDPESPLGKFKASGKYEHSPMPQSGESISPEEDLAEVVSMYLTSPDSRNTLMAQYPMRYQLISGYFERVLPGMVRAKQSAGAE